MLDKAVLVLDAVEGGADTLAALTEATGLSRATTHRLAVALETHRLLARDREGRWRLGPRLGRARPAGPRATRCWTAPAPCWPGCATPPARAPALPARPASAGCASPRPSAAAGCATPSRWAPSLPMTAGSAAQVLLAWRPEDPLLHDRRLHPPRARRGAAARLGRVGGRARAGRRVGVGPGARPRRAGRRGGQRQRAARAAHPLPRPAARRGRARGGRRAQPGADPGPRSRTTRAVPEGPGGGADPGHGISPRWSPLRSAGRQDRRRSGSDRTTRRLRPWRPEPGTRTLDGPAPPPPEVPVPPRRLVPALVRVRRRRRRRDDDAAADRAGPRAGGTALAAPQGGTTWVPRGPAAGRAPGRCSCDDCCADARPHARPARQLAAV